MILRSSLSRAPSNFTPEQVVERSRQHQCRAWSDGLLVVHVEDDRLTWPERELLKQLGNRLAGGAL